MLVLKHVLGLDYRGIIRHVAHHRELRHALGLHSDTVPNYTTLCYAAKRLLPPGPTTDAMMKPFMTDQQKA